jgi:Ala-tRNA(Pro) deacylase
MNYDPVLYTGRPEDKREEREERCYELLDRLQIPFYRVDHEHAETIEDCEQVEGLLGCRICKNLFLCNRQKTNFYLLIMPGDKPFKTKELSGQLGVSRLSFADEEQMERLLDLHPGSVSVLGLMNDAEHRVRLVIDEDVLGEELFGCHPCENTSSIRFATKALTEKILPALGVTPAVVRLKGFEET